MLILPLWLQHRSDLFRQDSPNACVTMALPLGIFEHVCFIHLSIRHNNLHHVCRISCPRKREFKRRISDNVPSEVMGCSEFLKVVQVQSVRQTGKKYSIM
jgi:hypothetical protein